MSMIGSYLRISSDQARAMEQQPAVAAELAFPPDGNYPEPPISFDLDKSWHLIHFLLTGEAWGGEGPLGKVVLGGQEVAGTDAGYGPFRLLNPAEVREGAVALASLDSTSIWARFDAVKANAAQIYPQGWVGDDMEREYICQNYEGLRQFYVASAASGDALLLYIC